MTLSKSCIVMRSVACMDTFFSRNKSLAEAVTAVITVKSWEVVSSSAATFLPYVAEKWSVVIVD